MKTGASDLRDIILRKINSNKEAVTIELEIDRIIGTCPMLPRSLSHNPLIYLISDIFHYKPYN